MSFEINLSLFQTVLQIVRKIHYTMQITNILLSTLTLLPSGTLAWGAYGHETVAYVASNFVAPSTATYFKSLLGDTSANYLASVAAFADSYRSTTAGRFSAPFHYVDARDSPPSSCSVNFDRDCGADGCVISAIANYVRFFSSDTLLLLLLLLCVGEQGVDVPSRNWGIRVC